MDLIYFTVNQMFLFALKGLFRLLYVHIDDCINASFISVLIKNASLEKCLFITNKKKDILFILLWKTKPLSQNLFQTDAAPSASPLHGASSCVQVSTGCLEGR